MVEGEEENGGAVVALKTPDKSKRDEWSEGGAMSLLDVYESKWLLRNRAKLKASDWEDIARQVSASNSGRKLVKTPNQCKNKIESMKKRYRAQSAAYNHSGSDSPWQFYARMDGLLKGTQCLQPKAGDGVVNGMTEAGNSKALPNLVDDLENDAKGANGNDPAQTQAVENAQVCETNVLERQGRVQDINPHDSSNMAPDNIEYSTQLDKVTDVADKLHEMNDLKRRKILGSDMAKSIKGFAHSVLRIEEVRMEMYRDVERLRVEAEIKRAEMDLRRTEILAKTQLQIAKLFVKKKCTHNHKSGNASVATEPIVTTNIEEKRG